MIARVGGDGLADERVSFGFSAIAPVPAIDTLRNFRSELCDDHARHGDRRLNVTVLAGLRPLGKVGAGEALRRRFLWLERDPRRQGDCPKACTYAVHIS